MGTPTHEASAHELYQETRNQQHVLTSSLRETQLKHVKFEDTSESEEASEISQQTAIEGSPQACSTPLRNVSVAGATTDKHKDVTTDQEILEEQKLKPGEPQPESFSADIRAALSISRSDSGTRPAQTATITGLPDSFQYKNLPSPYSRQQENKLATKSSPEEIEFADLTLQPTTSRQQSRQSAREMGNTETKRTDRTNPKHIISEEPFHENRKRILDSEVTGNCRPWSDHVYYKLFLDTEGRNATLMVLKCEITYVDVFTDEEHSLYKSRFIGGKADGVAQLFVFDLMKSQWEEKIPQSQAIELNVDIVMSSSPIHQCSESLLNLLQLEKTYLRHRNFDGQLNVMIRFAHSHGWEVRDDAIRERVHNGLRNLFREGVNLEVMSADVILEEMRVDGILATNDERIKHYIAKRHAWRGPTPKSTKSHGSGDDVTNGDAPRQRVDSSASEEDFEYIAEDDMYHVNLLDKIDQILANQYPSRRTVHPKSSRGRGRGKQSSRIRLW